MNWVKLSTLAIALTFIAVPTLLHAQSDLRKAEKYIDIQHFGSAIEVLNGYASLDEDQAALILLARAYNGANQLKTAKSYFESASQLGMIPAEASLVYGQTLMALEEYEPALEQFSLYGAEYPDHSVQLITQCGYAIEHRDDPSDFTIRAEYLNTSRRDFSPTYFEEDIVYLSDREDISSKKSMSGSSIELLKSSRDSKSVLKYPKIVKTLTGQAFDIVSIAYNPTLGIVAVTKGQPGFPTNTTSDKCTLFIGNYNRHGGIEDLKPYEFNLTDFGTGMATFSADGMTMYMSSDRAGGYGGYDIYESKLMNGQWSSPINLGSAVNTAGNEITPYNIGDLLLFASNGREGFGGYDLYKTYNTGTGYGTVVNLGTKINSSADDFSMTYNPVTNDGYLVSNRASGKGLEDIYRYTTQVSMLDYSEKGIAEATDRRTSDIKADYEILKGMTIDNFGNPIGQVEVQASADDESTVINAETNDLGVFSIPLEEGLYYTLKFKGIGYQKASRTIKMEASRSMPLLKVELTPDQVVVERTDEVIAKPVSLNSKHSNKRSSTMMSNESVASKELETSSISNTTVVRPASIKPAAEKAKVAPTNSTVQPYKAPENMRAYAIQLAALSTDKEVGYFSNLKDLGTLYTLYDNRIYRVRCGLFTTKEEAASVLKRVKARGYEQSFIVTEKPNDNEHLVMMDFGGINGTLKSSNSEDIAVAAAKGAVNYSRETVISPYKVRLATYTDPKWFDGTKLVGEEFGYVEVILKGAKSIYLLAGFETLDQAIKARNNAEIVGFRDAVVVKDSNGNLQKID